MKFAMFALAKCNRFIVRQGSNVELHNELNLMPNFSFA